MTNQFSLKGCSVLIIDDASLSAADVSNRLSALGAKVHVVANAVSAIGLARAKRLDVALIGYRTESPALKRTLDEYGVPYVLCGVTVKGDVDYERVFSLSLSLQPNQAEN